MIENINGYDNNIIGSIPVTNNDKENNITKEFKKEKTF